jgi:DNA helicase-2/ATP-dependent DNA helicase PcrA
LIGSKSFFDRREIRDICAMLQVMVRPSDDAALRRIINVPARGVSKPAVEKLIEKSVTEGRSMWATMEHATKLGLSTPAEKGCAAFRTLIQRFQVAFHATNSMAQTLQQFLDEIGFLVEIRSRYQTEEEIASREASIEQIVNAIDEYDKKRKKGKSSLLGFLDDLALASRDMESDKDRQLKNNSVMLMTMHSAKGLEFPRVYLVGMEEGILPHHRSIDADARNNDPIEEERRLCYVGITRAQDALTVSLALTRRKWGKPRPTDASRFLFEMTGQAEKFIPNRSAKSPQARLAAARKKRAAAASGKRRPAKKRSH